MAERELRKQRKWKCDSAEIMTPLLSPHLDAATAEPQPGPSIEQTYPSVRKTSGRKKVRRNREKPTKPLKN